MFEAGVPGTKKSTKRKKGLNKQRAIKVPAMLKPT